MKIRKDMIFAVLTTFCLSALMFAVIPIRSGLPYDAWSDIDDSGKIDMKDIGNVAARFMTSGDSAKNVTVTNFSARFLNVTLADNLVIEGAYEFEADVAGYSKITLVLWKGYEPFSMTMDIIFQIGSVYTPSIYANNIFSTGYQFLLKNYEVLGQKILITMFTYGPLTISLGLYATD